MSALYAPDGTTTALLMLAAALVLLTFIAITITQSNRAGKHRVSRHRPGQIRYRPAAPRVLTPLEELIPTMFLPLVLPAPTPDPALVDHPAEVA